MINLLKDSSESVFLEQLNKFFGLGMELRYYTNEKHLQKEEIKQLAPFERFPYLQLENLSLNNFFVIVKYLCRKGDQDFAFENLDQETLADQYMIFLSELNEFQQKYVQKKEKKEDVKEDKIKLDKQWVILNQQLLLNNFLVGTKISYLDFITFFLFKQFDQIDNSLKIDNVKRVAKFIKSMGIDC